jgi:hypothetical protein
MSQVFKVPVTALQAGPTVQDVLHGQHAAPGTAEQVQSGQAEGGADLGQFLNEPLDGPQRGVVRAFGPPAAQLVVEDDLAAVGERLERLQVVVGEAGAAVQAQQRGPVFLRLPDTAVPDLSAGDVEVALAPAGAMEVTDWKRTSRSPMAPRARVVPLVAPLLAMAPSFAHLPSEVALDLP